MPKRPNTMETVMLSQGAIKSTRIMKYRFVLFLQILVFAGCQLSPQIAQSNNGIQKNESPIEGTREMLYQMCLASVREPDDDGATPYAGKVIVATVKVDEMTNISDPEVPNFPRWILTLSPDLKKQGRKDSILSSNHIEFRASHTGNMPEFVTEDAVLRITGVIRGVLVDDGKISKGKGASAKVEGDHGVCDIYMEENLEYESVN
jgi:hypothetical protein